MKYEFAKSYGGLKEITSKEAKFQMDMINMKLNGEYNVVVNKRVLRIKCIGVYGQTRRVKIMDIGATKNNYYVQLKTDTKSINKLLYQSFVGEVPRGCTVGCKDGDIENITIENMMLIPKTKGVIRIDEEEKELEYYSTEEAAEKNYVSVGALRQCLRGKSKICAGYRWKYK